MIKKKRSFLTPWRVALSGIFIAIIIGLATWLFLADKNVAVLNPQGIIARQQLDLIIFTTILSLIVVIPVFTLLGVIAWRYREGNTKATYTPDADGNKWLEILWWGIPILIIGILSVVTWVSTHQLDPYKPLTSDVKPVKVQVVALQWKWLFLYPEQNIATLNELKIPVDTPVNFEITADGPMSAFWIPNLGSQTYAMSGMSSKLSLQADKPGQYRGSNTNINGKGYAGMNFEATVLPSRAHFDDWAGQIESAASHSHMDEGIYEELAKPSEANPVKYYHLHDTHLYTKVVNKYMSHGTAGSSGHTDASDHTEGNTH